MKAYDEVFRDCQYIHGFTEEDVQKFLDLANVFSGMNVLDAMCGNGVLSKELIKIKGINLSLLYKSENQLKDAKKQIKNAKFMLNLY